MTRDEEHERTMRSLDFWARVITAAIIVISIPIIGVVARFVFWPLCVAVVTGECGGKPCQF